MGAARAPAPGSTAQARENAAQNAGQNSCSIPVAAPLPGGNPQKPVDMNSATMTEWGPGQSAAGWLAAALG